MNINHTNNLAFRGYDARQLEYLIIRPSKDINNTGIITELHKVAEKNGIKLILDCNWVTDKIPKCQEQFSRCKTHMFIWAQDRLYFYKNKFFRSLSDDNFTLLHHYLGLPQKDVNASDFIAGGNLFFIKDKGKEKILVGVDEPTKKIKKLFGNDNYIKVPQANFHIDMFIRPLKDNVILAADDTMTLQILHKAHNNLKTIIDAGENSEAYKTALKTLDEARNNMVNGHKWTEYDDTDQVIKTLTSQGFKVIRVPGRVYSYDKHSDITDYINFMNAIVHQKENGELVYITNDINLQEDLGLTYPIAKKIGLDLKNIFKNAIKDYVNPENVFFINGTKKDVLQDSVPTLLKEKYGGIHCMTVEVPKGVLPENVTKRFDKYI